MKQICFVLNMSYQFSFSKTRYPLKKVSSKLIVKATIKPIVIMYMTPYINEFSVP